MQVLQSICMKIAIDWIDLISSSFVFRKVGIAKWPFRDTHRQFQSESSGPLNSAICANNSENHDSDPQNRRQSNMIASTNYSEGHPSWVNCCHDQNTFFSSTDAGEDNGPIMATPPELPYARYGACHDAVFPDDAYPVEEVDAASSPSSAGSGSDAERLDCTTASDELGLLLGSGVCDSGLDVNGADVLLRIAPFAHWCPHTAFGDEAMCDHAVECEEGPCAAATGNYDDGRGTCDEDSMVCTLFFLLELRADRLHCNTCCRIPPLHNVSSTGTCSVLHRHVEKLRSNACLG
jgi:hypothetical protein